MIGALLILLATVIIGVLLYFADKYYYKGKKGEEPEELPAPSREITVDENGDQCCGQHAVCEKTNLSPLTPDYEYYDDEELDRFRGRDPESYTEEESEEFREILMTLLPADVAGWSRSLQVREIALPLDVREELLMIVADLRAGS